MAAASAPKDPTDDLHEQELPDFPDKGESVDSPGVGDRKC